MDPSGHTKQEYSKKNNTPTGTPAGGSNPNWEAHNVVNYAKLKEQYRVSELANDVVDSIKETETLPDNYITKTQVKALGWSRSKALNNYARSRAKNPGYRILYSNDGLIYGTFDHYKSVFQILP